MITKDAVMAKAYELLNCGLRETGKDEDFERYAFFMEGVIEMAQTVVDMIDGNE